MLYGTGVTSLRPQLRRWSDAKLHVVVVTVKDSAFTSRSFASAVRTLLATGRFAVRCMARVPGSCVFELRCTMHRRRIRVPCASWAAVALGNNYGRMRCTHTLPPLQ